MNQQTVAYLAVHLEVCSMLERLQRHVLSQPMPDGQTLLDPSVLNYVRLKLKDALCVFEPSPK